MPAGVRKGKQGDGVMDAMAGDPGGGRPAVADRTCLVVDDSRVVRRAARRMLEGLGFAEFGPDRPVVVLCTTKSGLERIVEALAAGAQEYVMKPFDAAILEGKFSQLGLLPSRA
jgi:two-component system chemotaxis response regulator CheY